MPTTFAIADDDLRALLAAVMREHHPQLAAAGVRVDVLLAFNPDGPAVTGGGYPALAKVKVIPLRDRLRKEHDAEIHIDEREWRELTPEQKAATLDHELAHLALVPLSPKGLRAAQANDSAAPWWRLDDIGRPRLRTVKGDWMVGDGFAAVVARHGADAVEYLTIARAKLKADAARRQGEAGRQEVA